MIMDGGILYEFLWVKCKICFFRKEVNVGIYKMGFGGRKNLGFILGY